MKTPATEFLQAHGVPYTEHYYEYVEHGGAERGADELGVPAAEVVKTLVMQDEKGNPLIVLMHGDRKVAAPFGLPGRRHLAFRQPQLVDAALED